jgi:hypothetical protein
VSDYGDSGVWRFYADTLPEIYEETRNVRVVCKLG